MKKTQLALLSLLFAFVLLAACSADEQNRQTTTVGTNETDHSEEVPDQAVRMTISLEDGSQFINEQQVQIEKGMNLLDLLEDTFFVETNDQGEITSIERMRADQEKGTSWKLYINDEAVDIQAKDYTLSGGEKIVFDLQ